MGTQDFGSMDPNASLKQVIDALADLMDTLNFLLNGNLDVKNIRAQSITADRMDVQQLSAIAADLGTITAGIIYGAYIATSNGTFPRIEFSSVNKLLTAFSDALNHVDVTPSVGGAPGISWTVADVLNAYLQSTPAGPLLTSLGGTQITLQASSHLNLDSSGDVKLGPSASLRINGSAGQTGTVYVSATSGGVANIPISFTKGIRTS